MNRVISLGIASALTLLCLPVWAASKTVVDKNNSGVEALIKENRQQAYADFLEALALEPFNELIKMNLGLAFEANEEYKKALKEYLSAYRYAQTDEVKFFALFNAALVNVKLGNIDGALDNYQQALELKPDSEEVRTNIELLWQQGQGKGGGGEGEGQQDQESKDDQEQQGEQPQEPKQKPQPKPFQGKELSPDDVRKILEELKNQEQKIRAKEYEGKAKQESNEKDW